MNILSTTCKFLACLIFFFQNKLGSGSAEPNEGLIKQLLQKSYHQCLKECGTHQNCRSAKHIRLSSLCVLYSNVFDGILGPGVTVYIKSDEKRIINLGQCQTNEKCEDSCGKPALIPGTEILGNMVSVGAKIRFRCTDGSNSGISECLPNGTWSLTNLTCNCTSSHLEDNWTYKETENIGYDTD